MIEYFKRTISQKKLEKLEDFKTGCWVNVEKPTKKEIDFLIEKFKIERDLVEDAFDDNELPRFDHDEDDNRYIFLKTSSKRKNFLTTILVILGPNFLMTLSKDDDDSIEKIKRGFEKIITTQRLKTLISILDLINEDMSTEVQRVVKNVQVKKRGTTKLKEKDLEVLLEYKDFLNELVSTYTYNLKLYNKIIKNVNFYEEDKDLVEDLIIEAEEGLFVCRSALKTINNIVNYYSLILTNKLNSSIKFLTIMTIVLTIPSFVGALYGMNVKLPFQEEVWAFWFVLVIIFMLIGVFLALLRKKDIL